LASTDDTSSLSIGYISITVVTWQAGAVDAAKEEGAVLLCNDAIMMLIFILAVLLFCSINHGRAM